MARGGGDYCYREVAPFAAMVCLQFISVGLNTLFKVAANYGMSLHIFLVYSYAVTAVILLPSPFFFRRSRVLPSLNLWILLKIFLLGAVGNASVMMGFRGIDYGSPTLASAMGNLASAVTFVLAIIFRQEVFTCAPKPARGGVRARALGISTRRVGVPCYGARAELRRTGRRACACDFHTQAERAGGRPCMRADAHRVLVPAAITRPSKDERPTQSQQAPHLTYGPTSEMSHSKKTSRDPIYGPEDPVFTYTWTMSQRQVFFNEICEASERTTLLAVEHAAQLAIEKVTESSQSTDMSNEGLSARIGTRVHRRTGACSRHRTRGCLVRAVLCARADPVMRCPARRFQCVAKHNPTHRMKKVELSSRSSWAKVVGTMVSIAGAFVVTFYKGLSINAAPSSAPSLHQLLDDSSRSDWIIGNLFVTIQGHSLHEASESVASASKIK
ncbi:nodulin MtN21 /EamA-like transporter family protein [Perilla frutescens var. frutescens]|nr:nodulin MtN21 /EamA-like transporter family protein [Perilla frutescens var. frutescens]